MVASEAPPAKVGDHGMKAWLAEDGVGAGVEAQPASSAAHASARNCLGFIELFNGYNFKRHVSVIDSSNLTLKRDAGQMMSTQIVREHCLRWFSHFFQKIFRVF